MWRARRSAIGDFRSWRLGDQKDRKDHGSPGSQAKRRPAAPPVNGHSDQKAEQREAIEAWHDPAQQCKHPA